jgi:hypothetical protein
MHERKRGLKKFVQVSKCGGVKCFRVISGDRVKTDRPSEPLRGTPRNHNVAGYCDWRFNRHIPCGEDDREARGQHE